jgi:hypothetical protein
VPAVPVLVGAGPKPNCTDFELYDDNQETVATVPDDEVDQKGLLVGEVVLCQLPPASP